MSAYAFFRGQLMAPGRWLALGLVMAVTGMAGIWRLPYLAGQHGGAYFLAVYGLALTAMGWPLLAGQLLLTRGQGGDLVRLLAHRTPEPWAPVARLVGGCLLVAIAALLAVYAVVTSWVLAYTARALGGDIAGQTPVALGNDFAQFLREPERGLGWLLLFWIVIALVAALFNARQVWRALAGLFGLAFCLVVALALHGHGFDSARFGDLLAPGPMRVGDGLVAITQAFYALGLGSGVALALGQTMTANTPVFRSAGLAVLLVAAIGLASCLAWPMIFEPGALAQLASITAVLQHAPAALADRLDLGLFYALLTILALSSAIALFEVLLQTLVLASGLSRARSALSLAGLLLILGLCVQHDLAVAVDGQPRFFDLLTMLAADIVFPLTALWLVFLLGVLVPPATLFGEPALAGRRVPGAWRIWQALLRHPARLGVIMVGCQALGLVALVRRFWSVS